MRGVKELRVKESTGSTPWRGPAAAGVEVEEGPDWWIVQGAARTGSRGAVAETRLDHRIAMSCLILGWRRGRDGD
jgi:3-phosphoshikimate 1-carboxyvinyltransferase